MVKDFTCSVAHLVKFYIQLDWSSPKRFRFSGAAVLNYILLQRLCADLRPSDKPLLHRLVRYWLSYLHVNKLTCTPTRFISWMHFLLWRLDKHGNKAAPLRACRNALGITHQMHVGTSYMTQQAFIKFLQSLLLLRCTCLADSGVNHKKPGLETLPCGPHPDTTPKTDTPSCFWSY